ncbi:MAG: hypothetical protein GXP10_02430, partial [Gammaproteobacteria bacterium]|nr:hypothetical protein [Gammaproteobacteria bacterium]
MMRSRESSDGNQAMNTQDIRYRFHCADGQERQIDLHLDPLTLEQVAPPPVRRAPWT